MLACFFLKQTSLPHPYSREEKELYNNAIAAPAAPKNPHPPNSIALGAAAFDDVAAGAGAVPDGEPVAEEPGAELTEEPDPELGEADKTSVPLALVLSSADPVVLTPVPFLQSPATADV